MRSRALTPTEHRPTRGTVAQLEEHSSEKRRVGSSILPGSTMTAIKTVYIVRLSFKFVNHNNYGWIYDCACGWSTRSANYRLVHKHSTNHSILRHLDDILLFSTPTSVTFSRREAFIDLREAMREYKRNIESIWGYDRWK